MPRLPFPLGAIAPPPATIPPPPPFWTPGTARALSWTALQAGQIPRFEHIYPQESGAAQQFVNPPLSIIS